MDSHNFAVVELIIPFAMMAMSMGYSEIGRGDIEFFRNKVNKEKIYMWDYAGMSREAKLAGGPQKYVEMLEYNSRNAGRMEMIPIVVISTIISPLIFEGIKKLMGLHKANEEKIKDSKEKLIDCIEEYNETRKILAENSKSDNDYICENSEHDTEEEDNI